MTRRPSEADDDGGLDALLDTMTNVVGILVLVLIVTQMSVADVVTRVTAEVEVNEEKIADVQQQLQRKRAEVDELKQILVDPLDIDPEAQREELRRSKALLERRKRLLEQSKQQKNQHAQRIAAEREMAEQKSQQLKQLSTERETLSKQITESLEKKAQLESVLEEASAAPPAEDVQVSIPNPRPAPPGAKEVVFVCSENQIFPVNAELFRQRAQARAKTIIARGRLDLNPQQGIDPEKFTAAYERLKDRDDFFDVEYYVQSETWPRLRLIPREGRGATTAMLATPRSDFRQRVLSQLNPSQYYARFFVLPDSFEIYLDARSLFTKQGFLAGWEPQNEDWLYTTGIGGGIRLGPPPPPPTDPPDPNAPKPKPPSVID